MNSFSQTLGTDAHVRKVWTDFIAKICEGRLLLNEGRFSLFTLDFCYRCQRCCQRIFDTTFYTTCLYYFFTQTKCNKKIFDVIALNTLAIPSLSFLYKFSGKNITPLTLQAFWKIFLTQSNLKWKYSNTKFHIDQLRNNTTGRSIEEIRIILKASK